MGDVVLDLDGLLSRLRARGFYSLPLEISPLRPGTDLGDIAHAVEAAIAETSQLALARVPHDPTSCSGPSVALKSVMAEIDDGLMTEHEITAWLTDFAASLEGHSVKVSAPKEPERVPWQTIETWAEGRERVPTGFLFFSAPVHAAPNGRLRRRLAPEVLNAVSEDVEHWVRLPGGVMTLSRGYGDFVIPPGQGAAQLRAVYGEQLSLKQFTLAPRRHAQVDFTFGAKATMQVFDESRSVTSCLWHLLDGLRAFAPWLDYAYVRMDRPVLPSERVWSGSLGRDETEAESLFQSRGYAADQYVIGPCVAQVLNPKHLEKNPHLTGFNREDLGNGRVLVTADHLEPWLSGPNPEAAAWSIGERAFHNLILTRHAHERIPWRAS